jgi:hypothetical protein
MQADIPKIIWGEHPDLIAAYKNHPAKLAHRERQEYDN